jgi:SAM-dependent methyltransferase
MSENPLKMLSWHKIADAWSKYTAPLRPTPETINFYRNAIINSLHENRYIKVLILGSTPEVRDIFEEFKFSVDVICSDLSLEMYMAMSSITNFKNQNEMFLLSDWNTMPLAENSFDLIIGDNFLTGVIPVLQHPLLSKLRKLLKPTGLLVHRICYDGLPANILNLEEVFDKFSTKEAGNETISDFILCLQTIASNRINHFYTRSQVLNLINKFWNKDLQLFQHPQEQINKLLNHPNFIESIHVDKDWDFNTDIWYESLFKRNFNIVEKTNPDSNRYIYKQIFPSLINIYILKPLY